MIGSEISAKISMEWDISKETVEGYESYFAEKIRPIIQTNYLSHLVATVENMVNESRMRDVLEVLEGKEPKAGREWLKGHLSSRTFRLFSIVLAPANLKRRATTRHHFSGAIIYYSPAFDENTIRILIAHEIGHIVNRELLKKDDTERAANLFAYIALHDKNSFYRDECDKYIFSDIQIFNDIGNACPVKK
jgi:hypothetical protein